MELPFQLALKLGPLLGSPRVEIGLAYRHRVTGAAWEHNDHRFAAGDLIRLPLAMAAYQAVEEGRTSLTRPAGAAGTTTLRDLLFALLTAPSGTQAATADVGGLLAGGESTAGAILELIGPGFVSSALARWGLTRTVVKSPLGAQDRSFTTPKEMATLLEKLVGSEDLDPAHALEILAYLRLSRSGALPARIVRRDDPAQILAIGPDFCHLAVVSAGQLTVVLAQGRARTSILAKASAAIDAFYSGAGEGEIRVREILEEERKLQAPDPRLVAWDIDVEWKDGGLEVTGSTSAPSWDRVTERLGAVPEVPVTDRVRKLPASRAPAIVLAPVVHLRRSPAHAAEMVSQVLMGSLLEVLETREDWWLVRAPDGTVAWARSANLQALEDADARRWAERDQLLVTAPLLWARRPTGGTLGLSAGTRLALVGRHPDGQVGRTPGHEEVILPEDSCQVRGSQGRGGLPDAADVAGVLQLARRFLGVPYLWGGTSGWGIDCSGLTQLVLGLVGVRLPRDSDQQLALARQRGLVATILDLEPGDLAFFPGHVGLYLGRGELLHASAPAGHVTVNALLPGASEFLPSLARKFLGGGRFLGRGSAGSGATGS